MFLGRATDFPVHAVRNKELFPVDLPTFHCCELPFSQLPTQEITNLKSQIVKLFLTKEEKKQLAAGSG